MRIAIDMADAVAGELLTGTFSEPIIITRRVLPEYELTELKTLTVTVVPKSVEITNVTRDSSSYQITIDIGVQQKVGKDTDAEVLRLSWMVTEIVAFLNRRSVGLGRFLRIANAPVYAPEHLSENRLFTSVVTVSYLVQA